MFVRFDERPGGEGGIRTPDTLSGMPVFKTGAINHSATSPWLLLFYYRVDFMAEVMSTKRRIANRTLGAGLDCAVMRPRLLTSHFCVNNRQSCFVINRRDPCTSPRWQVGVTTIQEAAHRVRFRQKPTRVRRSSVTARKDRIPNEGFSEEPL